MHDYLSDLFGAWQPLAFTDEFMEWIGGIFGIYNPSELSLPWSAFIDWSYLLGAVVLVVCIISLFKLLGTVLKR